MYEYIDSESNGLPILKLFVVSSSSAASAAPKTSELNKIRSPGSPSMSTSARTHGESRGQRSRGLKRGPHARPNLCRAILLTTGGDSDHSVDLRIPSICIDFHLIASKTTSQSGRRETPQAPSVSGLVALSYFKAKACGDMYGMVAPDFAPRPVSL